LQKGITDVDKLAHTVEEYQPTGYTLSSTKVYKTITNELA
jgi:hypothetical protein